jgi:hypothetical protein
MSANWHAALISYLPMHTYPCQVPETWDDLLAFFCAFLTPGNSSESLDPDTPVRRPERGELAPAAAATAPPPGQTILWMEKIVEMLVPLYRDHAPWQVGDAASDARALLSVTTRTILCSGSPVRCSLVERRVCLRLTL